MLRETTYTLTHLCKVELGEERKEFDPDFIKIFYRDSGTIKELIDHTTKDAYFTISLVFKLNVIPLTKQLTNIAGNLWFRSLQNARLKTNSICHNILI